MTEKTDKVEVDDGSANNDDTAAKIAAAVEAAEEKIVAAFKVKMDALNDKNKASEQKIKDVEHEAEVKALKEKGELEEARQKELEKEREINQTLMAHNTALTRDSAVTTALSGADFASTKAMTIATRDIATSLTKNDDGVWVGNKGESIQEVAAAFVADEGNSFLLKTKKNKGTGNLPNGEGDPSNKTGKKNIKDMTREEVMEAASNGEFADLYNGV